MSKRNNISSGAKRQVFGEIKLAATAAEIKMVATPMQVDIAVTVIVTATQCA